MLSWLRISAVALLFSALLVLPLQAQNSEQLEVGPPPLHRADPPAPGASPEELEQRGDELRTEKNFLDAIDCYSKAMQLDPAIFERTSRAGVLAQLPSPEDRAHYDYVLAKLYARTGVPERSLHYLKKAMEEGYKDIKKVYTDNEFSPLRKDPRFAELMAAKTTAIPG